MVHSIQYLRFYAAFAVVLLHSFEIVGREFHQGQYGVDVFFVISGFVIYLASARESSGTVFFIRRFLRVALPYYVILLFVIMDASVLGLNRYFFGDLSLWEAVLAFLFWFQESEGNGYVLPIYRIGWTLNFEIFFYLVFSLSVLLSFRYRLAVCAAVIVGLSAVQWVYRFDGGMWYMHQTRTAIEFIYGMVIAAVYLRFYGAIASHRATVPVALALVAMGLVFLLFGPRVTPYSGDRFLYGGVPAAMLVAGAVMLELRGRIKTRPVLLYLGGASYSIYLVHYLVVKYFAQFVDDPGPIEIFAVVIVMVSLSLVLSLAFHHLVERPMHRFSRGIRYLPLQRSRQMPDTL